MSHGTIFVVSAPSGAGKTTLLRHVCETVPHMVYSISATTRAPRNNEVNGRDYFFLTEEQFIRKIERNELAEWQQVHGYYYGTPKAFVEETIAKGDHVVMDLDVHGKTVFERVFPDSVSIFISPPSRDELQRRLCARNTESEEALAVRLANAEKEMAYARTQGNYTYEIVNDDLERARREIVHIVIHEIAKRNTRA